MKSELVYTVYALHTHSFGLVEEIFRILEEVLRQSIQFRESGPPQNERDQEERLVQEIPEQRLGRGHGGRIHHAGAD